MEGGGGGADAGVLEGLVQLPLLGIGPRLGRGLVAFGRGYEAGESLEGVLCGGGAIGGGVVRGGR